MPRLDVDRAASALARHLRRGAQVPESQLPDFLIEVLMPLGLVQEARCLGAAIRIGLPDGVRHGQPPTAGLAAGWVERLINEAKLEANEAEDVVSLWTRALRLDPSASAGASPSGHALRAAPAGQPWLWLAGGVVLGASVAAGVAVALENQLLTQHRASEQTRLNEAAALETSHRQATVQLQDQLQRAEAGRLDAERRITAANRAADDAIAAQRKAEADRAETIRTTGLAAVELREQLRQAQTGLASAQQSAGDLQGARQQVETLKGQLAQAQQAQDAAVRAANDEAQQHLDQAAATITDLLDRAERERQERERLLNDAVRQANDRTALVASLLQRDQVLQQYNQRQRGLAHLTTGVNEQRLLELMGPADQVERTPPQARWRYGGLTVNVTNGLVSGWQGAL